MDYNNPIPKGRSTDGWKDVKIAKRNEPLVLLNNYQNKFIEVRPQYFLQGIAGASANVYCRRRVAGLLLAAAKKLNPGQKFLIWDAWRPVDVQTSLFENFKHQLKPQFDGTEIQLTEKVQKYVSLPSIDEKKPSPHLTGGAVDLTIIDGDGTELNMGTTFDYFGVEAQTDFFEQKTQLLEEETIILKNRRFLYNLLTDAGFTNYPYEWWHFDYGNQFWGIQTGEAAFYTKILPPV